jgi:uncharacterized membrane protein YbhN (UPF0104 family)
VLGVLVSVAALAGVVTWALRQEAPTFPGSGEDLGMLGAAVAVYMAGCAARGERWTAILRHNGAHPSRADAYGLVAVGYLGNNVLPARAGDALRVLFLTPRVDTDSRTVIGTLLAERVLDIVVLLGLFAILAFGVLSGVAVPSAEQFGAAAALLVAVLAAAALGAWVLERRGHLRRLIAFLTPMAAATRRLHGRHGAEVLAWSLLVWGLEWAAWWATAQAAGLGVNFLETGYLLGLGAMFALVPSGPGFAGTLDAGVLFGVRALGRSGTAALSYLLLLRFVLIVPITLVGLVVLVTRFHGLGRLREARA